MDNELHELKKQILEGIEDAKTIQQLDQLYLQCFGRNGKLTKLLKRIQKIEPSKRPVFGKLINEVKIEISDFFKNKKSILHLATTNADLDITAPGIEPKIGHLHLVSQAIEEINSIFEKIGFCRQRYPEVEWEWYAFESLNMPSFHPARDDFETFFISDDFKDPKFGRIVLSPHTSSGQVREMHRVKNPPIRMINIAKCYRPNWDVSHTPMFHQFEGLVVDAGINISNLKGTLEYFVREFFGPERKIRLRPYHFQFTEPSFEVDITCDICRNKGCRLCKDGWLELGGAGMVHPNVLASGKINSENYSGFAFGWGVERTYMMRQGIKIDDLRLLYSNDLRFLEQF